MNAPEPELRGVALEERVIEFPAHDGYVVTGTLYRPIDALDPPDVLLFNSGGGLAVRRYRHFLRYLAGEGFPVLAYDYRGVGSNRPARLRGFVSGLEDWTEFDHAGAIDDIRTRYPNARLTTISHSIGALVSCCVPNVADQARLVLIAPHTGYWRDYQTAWKLPMTLMWHGLMPLLSRIVGYFPGSRIGLGDDFPLRFAMQWSGRMSPEIAIDVRDVRVWTLLGNAETLLSPVLALSFSDDAFASRAGVSRLLGLMPRAPVERCELDARLLARRIGHFGFFSRRNQALWRVIPHLLERMPARDTPSDVHADFV